MSISAFLPVGAAMGVMAARTAHKLAEGLSFQSILAADTQKPAPETVEHPPELRLEKAVPNLVRRLKERLQAAGIDQSQPVTLKLHGDDSIVVDGDHPDRAAIEELFHQDPELTAEFKAIAAAATGRRDAAALLSSGDRRGEFRFVLENGTPSIHFE